MIATVAAVAAHPGHWGFHPFWPFFIIGPLMFLIIVGLLIAILVRRRRWGGPGPWGWHGAAGGPGASGATPPWAGPAQSRTAEQILADRFAKGDVDETEYRARLEVLRANRPEA
jgi:putative membrane protein